MRKISVFLMLFFLSIQLTFCFSSSPKKSKTIYYKTETRLIEPDFDYKSIKKLLIVNGKKRIRGDTSPEINKKSTLAIAKALRKKNKYIVFLWLKGNYGPRETAISHGKRNKIDAILFIGNTHSKILMSGYSTSSIEDGYGGFDHSRNAIIHERRRVTRSYIKKSCDLRISLKIMNLNSGKTTELRDVHGYFFKEKKGYVRGKRVSNKFCKEAFPGAVKNVALTLVPRTKIEKKIFNLGDDLLKAIQFQNVNKIKKLLEIFKERDISLNQSFKYYIYGGYRGGKRVYGRAGLGGITKINKSSDTFQNTPLQMVLESPPGKKGRAIIIMLINNGADVNYSRRGNYDKPINRVNSIMYADLLIKKGARITDVDKRGTPSFHYIIKERGHNLKLMKFYISKGINVNARSKEGNVPLQTAIFAYNLKLARLLITHGADINIKNKRGDTILKMVNNVIKRSYSHRKKKFLKYRKFLIKNGALE